jgi:hypothetical protein
MAPKYWKLTTCARYGMAYHYYRCPQKALDEIAERFGVEWVETRYEDGQLASAVTMPTEEGRMFSLNPLVFEDEEDAVQ